ncbi:MAG: radical SAM protein, partial [Candidatus Omnitrophota bacterium]
MDRSSEERGFCGAGDQIKIYSYGPHHGEEPPISGKNGSGTIFFSNCCMGCVYCQNYQFSQAGRGRIISSSGLSEIIIELQNKGCHNINFVTPTHFAPGIMEALREAYIRGLNIPVVYNTGGFDSLDVIKSLDGVIDIYLPDMRYASNAMGRKYSNSPGYAVNNRLVIKEMFSQAGNLKMDGNGIAYRGLIIRLLVMPGGVSGTEETLEFIGRELGK